MSYAYDDLDAQKALRGAAYLWEGTAYSRTGEVPGPRGGIGCIRYSIVLAEGAGVIEPIDRKTIPDYHDDWSAHNKDSILDRWLEENGYIKIAKTGRIMSTDRAHVLTETSKLMIGDICVFAPGRCTHHLATHLGDDLITQSLKPTGVQTVNLFGTFKTNGRTRRPADWFAYAIRLKSV